MITRLGFLVVVLSCACGIAIAEDPVRPYVRVAELEIDPAQGEAFAHAIREVGEASVRLEEGCLVLYAVAETLAPDRVRVFEIYRDRAAYDAHLLTPHFRRFRATTDTMVKSRRLIDATAISLATKAGVTP